MPVQQTPILALQRATHLSLLQLGHALADLGLAPSDLNALANLSDGVGRTMSELSKLVGSPATTTTSVLDRLASRGYVLRSPDASDRRVVMVELTRSGKTVAARIRSVLDDLEATALAGMSDETLASFHAVLRALSGEQQ